MIPSAEAKHSPMMLQWLACKKKAGGALLLFRLGDFYEAFYEDAALLAGELDLTLTKRQEIPMAGVPFHSSEAYIDKLVAKGYQVAIAEQMEDPKSTKGLVKREVVRIVTPGTVVLSSLLSDKSNNYFACLTQVGAYFGLAFLDLTTAELKVLELEEKKELLDELYRLQPKELLLSEKFQKSHPDLMGEWQQEFKCTVNTQENSHFDHSYCLDFLLKHFHVHNLDGFGLAGMISAVIAAGALLSYVENDLSFSIKHIQTIQKEQLSSYMALDRATQRHLELLQPLHESSKTSTLLYFLDKTFTPMGGRLLKQWISHPLLSLPQIHVRQEAIEALLAKSKIREELSLHLKEVRDLERLIMRIEAGFASPRDLAALRLSLEQLPPLSALLKMLAIPYLLEDLDELDPISILCKHLTQALVDAPPLRLSDGGIFKESYHPELDRLRLLKSDSHAWIAKYLAHLKETTGIKTLKIGFTNVFGYYIEASRGQADKAPDFFIRRQTLVNAERFITQELKDFEEQVLSAEEKITTLENELFHALRKEVSTHAGKIRRLAHAIARLDCILALSLIAKTHNFVKPNVDESDTLLIEEGRHPVIEASLKGSNPFIPNDVHFDEQASRLLLITGPNMAGKSTYLRQVALLCILAQMGSFVPAKKAQIGLVDKVFSRIGASDDLSRGLSTFMVEMTETANILHNATSKSLVILDEIGRGTSTYDGISIAWAVADYLLTTKNKRAKTLFATHYWELTKLEDEIPGAVNYNVAVHESEKGIFFLHKILKGAADKSYGIHVARLAGLPAPVLKKAELLLKELENKSSFSEKISMKPSKQQQLALFAPPEQEEASEIVNELKKLDPNHTAPIEALKKLIEWKERLQKKV